MLRGGIALGAACTVGLLAIVTPGLAANASAANRPVTVAPVVVLQAEPRTGTTDAFTARGTSTDRSTTREEAEAVEAEVVEAAEERAEALESVVDAVVTTQTVAALETRTQVLTSTGTQIDAEASRVKAEIESGKFLWPTAGSISSPWGMRLHPILHYTRLHGGVDIGGSVGAPIYAVADGVVVNAASGYNGGSGNNVRIDHGTLRGNQVETAYLHMNDLSVKVGQQVKRGQLIGHVGNTGLSTSAHLHFSVYVNGANSDPAPFLYAGRR